MVQLFILSARAKIGSHFFPPHTMQLTSVKANLYRLNVLNSSELLLFVNPCCCPSPALCSISNWFPRIWVLECCPFQASFLPTSRISFPKHRSHLVLPLVTMFDDSLSSKGFHVYLLGVIEPTLT